jgi:tripartite-type tricarboxylate transporter receptor subunit TctC
MRAANVKLTHVPFAGWAEGSPALLGGHIEAIAAQPGEVRPQVEAKKMRVLCAFQPKRNAYFSDVPTCKEAGHDVHNGAQFMLVLPKAPPPDVVRYLHDAAKAVIEDPPFIAFAKARVIDVDYRTGDKLKADLWEEYKRHTDILKRIGMLK